MEWMETSTLYVKTQKQEHSYLENSLRQPKRERFLLYLISRLVFFCLPFFFFWSKSSFVSLILCICSWRVLRSLELFIWNLWLSTLKETFLLLPTRRRGLNYSNTIRWVLHHFWRFWASLNILVLNLFFFFLIECDWWYVQDCKGRSSFSTVDPFYVLVSFILSFSWSGMTFFIYVSLNKVLLMSLRCCIASWHTTTCLTL